MDRTEKTKEKKQINKLTIVIVILISIIVLAAAALAVVYIVSNINEKKREKEYGAMIEDLMDCYIDQDVEKYANLCYPGDFFQLEADAYYDGSTDDLKSDLKDNLKSENSSIKEYYGSQVEFDVKMESVSEASATDKSSIKSQMNSWTDTLDADEKNVKNAYRLSFDLEVKTVNGSSEITDCYAMIIVTEDDEKILWDWNFNDADWDTYTYYNED